MKNGKNVKVALCYDFDGTLSPQVMQEVDFIPALRETSRQFWTKVKENARDKNMDEILSYMNLMIDVAAEKQIAMTAKYLMRCGRNISFFKGVDTWFDRINAYGASKGIDVKHYVISSGIEEMIRGSSICRFLDHIFACKFAYEGSGAHLIAAKPATVVNYTNKTQHLFRINKGIFNYYENEAVNRYTPHEEKYIHFPNMIYIGDGETDVPCMKMVMSEGGHAIAVYNQDKETREGDKSPQQAALDLFEHRRANFIAPTDYSAGSRLEKIVQTLIDKIEVQERVRLLQNEIKADKTF